MKAEGHLARREANFQPLTPFDFLRRTVSVYPDQVAVIWRDQRWTYREFAALVGRFASVLRYAGLRRGDVVSIMAQNRPEMLAAHYAVPMVGAVLGAINTRLDANTVGYILEHSESRLFIVDSACSGTARQAALRSGVRVVALSGEDKSPSGEDFDDLLAAAPPAPLERADVTDEWQPICVNYTSGTTGRPKGVVYHHRGAYLNALGNVLALGFRQDTVYLWTLPMFHCNGWCHTWAVTAAAGTHVCLEKPDPAAIFAALERHGVTHFCCAPVILYMLLNHPDKPNTRSGRITVATGGAAPTSALIEALDALGIELVHLYGLTESYGPATACMLRSDWDVPSAAAKARALARQGVRHPTASDVRVMGDHGQEVPADASALGEIVLRGNTLMAGYLKDAAATEAAFTAGEFHTGDLAVRHPDGYIEIKDRAKDIIISGGENISSLEIETVLHRHPSVLLAAVVAAPDAKWGEVPCAFIELKPGLPEPPVEELAAFCRERLAGFKVPRRFLFRELPKTATGKIQKFGSLMSAVEFEMAPLKAYLNSFFRGEKGRLQVSRIPGGQSNPTFFVTLGERRLVLRKQPAGALLPSAHAVDREYRIMTALASTDVPVPKTILFCDDRSIVGTPFYVMERVEGRIFSEYVLQGVAPGERQRMYASFAETLARLHNIDPAAIGLADYGKAGNFFSRQIARWTRQWQLSQTRPNAHIERLIDWLPRHIPEDEETSIVHGDYRIGNVMIHAREPRIVALLDWELSTLGHPLADLAHSCIAWHSRPEEYGGLLGLDHAALGIPAERDYTAAYYRVARHPARMTHFHLAFALFRFAVIFEGIAARAKVGTAAASNALEVGNLAANFAKRAVEATEVAAG